jgi:Protein of unknown function (DUF3995)
VDEASEQGRRLGQAVCVVGLGYAAVSVYWAAGGTWLLSTVGDGLGKPGRADGLVIVVAVWAAAVLKLVGAIVPVAATGTATGQAAAAWKARLRLLAWAEAAILTGYGLVLTGVGLLVQTGVIAAAVGADHRALAWHAYLWDPWFLLWGVLVAAALVRSRHATSRAAEYARAR